MVDIAAPLLVANFLLSESRERGELLTNLKLQKLLYYGQAWHLALLGAPIFSEDFQAWVHGPVLPSQYRRFRDYRWQPITEEVEAPRLSNELGAHLIEVLDVFGVESAVALEMMTHRESPWIDARRGVPPDVPSETVIAKDAMQAYYRSMANG